MKTIIKKLTPFLFAAAIIFGAQAITANAQMMMARKGAPTVVLIKAAWCNACQKVDPIFTELKREYGGKLHFVVLDVTDEAAVTASAAKAKSLGLSKFFAANKKKTSTVAVFKKGKQLFITDHNYDRAAYTGAFNRSLN
ncbi:MAG: thioredoxin family protein [Pyrinomonadaceae bacterium]